MAFDDNLFLKGTSGQVFVNNTEMIEINKINVKMTGEYEDFSPCGEFVTHHAFIGWGGEGTLEGARIDTGVDEDIISAYTSGTVPDIKIYSYLSNPNTGATESYMFTGVQFTDVTPVDWEAKNLVKRSMPFTFTGVKVLSTIDR